MTRQSSGSPGQTRRRARQETPATAPASAQSRPCPRQPVGTPRPLFPARNLSAPLQGWAHTFRALERVFRLLEIGGRHLGDVYQVPLGNSCHQNRARIAAPRQRPVPGRTEPSPKFGISARACEARSAAPAAAPERAVQARLTPPTPAASRPMRWRCTHAVTVPPASAPALRGSASRQSLPASHARRGAGSSSTLSGWRAQRSPPCSAQSTPTLPPLPPPTCSCLALNPPPSAATSSHSCESCKKRQKKKRSPTNSCKNNLASRCRACAVVLGSPGRGDLPCAKGARPRALSSAPVAPSDCSAATFRADNVRVAGRARQSTRALRCLALCTHTRARTHTNAQAQTQTRAHAYAHMNTHVHRCTVADALTAKSFRSLAAVRTGRDFCTH